MDETEAQIDDVLALERELQSPEARRSEHRLRELLAPCFIEIGASGRRWDLETILSLLAAEADDARAGASAIRITGLEASVLAPGVIQTFWESDRDGRRARRTSLWQRATMGWQQTYHQGTPLT